MGNIGFIDTGTIGQITTVSSVTSTIGAAVVFPTTSTIGAAVSGALSTTSTVPVSFATSSTVQIVSAPGTGSTTEANIISRYYTSTLLFSSTVVATSGTVNSGTFSISNYEIKTVSVYVTGNSNSTLLIDVVPISAGTIYNYSSTHIPNTTFTAKSFTECFKNVRIQVVSGTANSTVDCMFGMMS